MSSSLVNYPHYIHLWDLLVCVIICPCDKWLPQHWMWLRKFSKATISSTIFWLLSDLGLSKYPTSQTWLSYGLISGTLKVTWTQENLLTDTSMLVVLLQLFEGWTQVFHSTRSVGNGITLLTHTEYKALSVLNTIDYNWLSTINNSLGIAKLTQKLTLLG